MFISQLYEESISDKQIVKRAGFHWKKIEAGDLNKGDSIMADKGFDIGDDFKKIDLKLDIPPLIKDQAAGLKITAGQRTMSGLIVDLTGQTFLLPVMLTGQNSIVLKMK